MTDFVITVYPIMNLILRMRMFLPRSKRGLFLYTLQKKTMKTKSLTVRWSCIVSGSSRFSTDILNYSHSLCVNIHILLLLLVFFIIIITSNQIELTVKKTQSHQSEKSMVQNLFSKAPLAEIDSCTRSHIVHKQMKNIIKKNSKV